MNLHPQRRPARSREYPGDHCAIAAANLDRAAQASRFFARSIASLTCAGAVPPM